MGDATGFRCTYWILIREFRDSVRERDTVRPTPAALIDEEFMAEIEAFFQKQTEFNERLEQRMVEQLHVDLCKRPGRFKTE